jgi:hypothetical protein
VALVLETLAKQYALEYHQASWGEIEDDVSLCVWARRVTGEELNLKQAGKFRKLLDAEVDKFPMVVIEVEGGVVNTVMSNDPRVRVKLVDYDNIREEEDRDAAEEEAREGTEGCTHEVF